MNVLNGTFPQIALAQINPLVGDIRGNADKIVAYAHQAKAEGADLVVFPELALTGYPPEDLLLRDSFLRQCDAVIDALTTRLPAIPVVLGAPYRDESGLHNGAIWLEGGIIRARYAKQQLPNYNVFDEQRYFVPGDSPVIVDWRGYRFGLMVCEDFWHPQPAQAAAQAGATMLIGINASPYHRFQYDERQKNLKDRIQETGLPIVYVNQVGGQDELLFDGGSFVLNAQGRLVAQASFFEESLIQVTDWTELPQEPPSPSSLEESIYKALVLGVRDYVDKNRFSGVVIGLSGGIDSALTLAIAVDALGADRVLAVSMPSRYTSKMSIDDARIECENLKVAWQTVSIELPFNAFLESLTPLLGHYPPDVTEENIQARCRGVLLMALSNKTGRMLLTTGNKSETAVGYATLYGDMAGGFAPLKDVFKTWVYRLAQWRNAQGSVIPERVLTRAPSAELAPNQTDQDVLPPYDILDRILEDFVEKDLSIEQIIASGYAESMVRRVAGMVLRNEYKRRQSPPGVRISIRAFGRDRRYPITSGYRCD